MPNSDIRHQDRALRCLDRALSTGRLAHGLIFHGPEGVGKEMAAASLAARLVCLRAAPTERGEADSRPIGHSHPTPFDACGACQSCRLTQARNHPDIHLIHRRLKDFHPDSEVRIRKGLTLGIDVLREFLIARAGLRPSLARNKVFIVREAELMNDAAQNSILKTLEEPPPDTYLILLTTAYDKLLSTLRSRCQAVPFQLLPGEFVAARLVELRPQISVAEAATIAEFAQGSLGRALQYADDGLHECARRLIPKLAGLQSRQALSFAKDLIDEAAGLGELYAKRDDEITDTEAQRRGLKAILMLLASECRRHLAATPSMASSRGIAFSPHRAAESISRIAFAERILDQSVNVQLTIESMALRLTSC